MAARGQEKLRSLSGRRGTYDVKNKQEDFHGDGAIFGQCRRKFAATPSSPSVSDLRTKAFVDAIYRCGFS